MKKENKSEELLTITLPRQHWNEIRNNLVTANHRQEDIIKDMKKRNPVIFHGMPQKARKNSIEMCKRTINTNTESIVAIIMTEMDIDYTDSVFTMYERNRAQKVKDWAKQKGRKMRIEKKK